MNLSRKVFDDVSLIDKTVRVPDAPRLAGAGVPTVAVAG